MLQINQDAMWTANSEYILLLRKQFTHPYPLLGQLVQKYPQQRRPQALSEQEVTVRQLVNVALSVWITVKVPNQRKHLLEAVS